MDKILVMNCGSSSLKYNLFDKDFNSILKGRIEKIGEKKSKLVHEKFGISGKLSKSKSLSKKVSAKNHKQAIDEMLHILHDEKWGGIKRITEISVVGHRVVHGGQMKEPTLVSKVALNYIHSFELLAPLHNPINIIGINETKKIMPNIPQVMVFDTEFHHTLPRKAYMYGLPYNFYDKYAVRKYGFHGTSHKYVMLRACDILGKKKVNLITCHLGNGSSITAIKNNKSIDTSMGMTPLEGVMMGTRAGDFDVAILEYLVKKYKMKYSDLFDKLNFHSGLLGVSGVSKDLRVVEGRAKKGNERCKLALEMFCYRVAKYIGSYAVVLGKIDAIVFTGGIGENSFSMRKKICEYLGVLGIKIDARKNKSAVGKEKNISSSRSNLKVLAIPTNEEIIIAKEAASLIKK